MDKLLILTNFILSISSEVFIFLSAIICKEISTTIIRPLNLILLPIVLIPGLKKYSTKGVKSMFPFAILDYISMFILFTNLTNVSLPYISLAILYHQVTVTLLPLANDLFTMSLLLTIIFSTTTFIEVMKKTYSLDYHILSIFILSSVLYRVMLSNMFDSSDIYNRLVCLFIIIALDSGIHSKKTISDFKAIEEFCSNRSGLILIGLTSISYVVCLISLIQIKNYDLKSLIFQSIANLVAVLIVKQRSDFFIIPYFKRKVLFEFATALSGFVFTVLIFILMWQFYVTLLKEQASRERGSRTPPDESNIQVSVSDETQSSTRPGNISVPQSQREVETDEIRELSE